jgi:hypothetical protein
MKIKTLLMHEIEQAIKVGETFDYWLTHDFIDGFVCTRATATHFIVTLSSSQLLAWNLTVEDVKTRLHHEGFSTHVIYTNPTKNRPNEFEVRLDGLREFVRQCHTELSEDAA